MRLSLPSFLIILSLLINNPLIKSEEEPPDDPESEKQLSGDTNAATGPDSSSGSGAEESGQLGHSTDSADGMYAHSHSILSFSLSLFVSLHLFHILYFSKDGLGKRSKRMKSREKENRLRVDESRDQFFCSRFFLVTHPSSFESVM